jgi:hypothetical protein
VRFEEKNRLRLAIFSDLEILSAETQYWIAIGSGRNNIHYDFVSRRPENGVLIDERRLVSPAGATKTGADVARFRSAGRLFIYGGEQRASASGKRPKIRRALQGAPPRGSPRFMSA